MVSIPVITTTKIFPKVLRCKWEAYRNTHGRRNAIQMGGVLTVVSPFPHSQKTRIGVNTGLGVPKRDFLTQTALFRVGGNGVF